jgi:hypothetical protein
MPHPTVGRIVHYRSYGTPNGEYKPECRAAIITSVGVNEQCSLAVMNPTGMFFNESVVHSEEDFGAGTWHWPEGVA